MPREDIVSGLKGGVIMAISSAPFAVLFGAIAVDNGLSIWEATMMSAVVYAGASQLVGIELFGTHVAPWLVVLSVFAVNFRHILYSAAITRLIGHFTPLQKLATFFLLTDPQFADTLRRAESGKPITFAWYLSFGLMIYVPWVAATLVGAWYGSQLGDVRVWAIDVLLPIYFMGLVLSFRQRRGFYPVVLVSAAASIAAYHLVGSPWHVSIGALAGILVAALSPHPPASADPSQALPHA